MSEYFLFFDKIFEQEHGSLPVARNLLIGSDLALIPPLGDEWENILKSWD